MSRSRRANCRMCGASDKETHISRTGLCLDCGVARYRATQHSIINKSGPGYDRWVIGLLNAAPPIGRPITPHDPDA